MLLVVSGASGSGKSAILPYLHENMQSVSWHEFDGVGVPADADTAWRQKTLRRWMQRAINLQEEGNAFGLCGQIAFGEVLASPEASKLAGIAFCHLDCGDVERIRRIRTRGSDVDQDTLSWAAWLRVHCVDPNWRPDVIKLNGVTDYEWDRWVDWQAGDIRWSVHCIDTTALSLDEVGRRVASWAQRELLNPSNPIAG